MTGHPLVEMSPTMAGNIAFALHVAADSRRQLGVEGPNRMDLALIEFDASWAARTRLPASPLAVAS